MYPSIETRDFYSPDKTAWDANEDRSNPSHHRNDSGLTEGSFRSNYNGKTPQESYSKNRTTRASHNLGNRLVWYGMGNKTPSRPRPSISIRRRDMPRPNENDNDGSPYSSRDPGARADNLCQQKNDTGAPRPSHELHPCHTLRYEDADANTPRPSLQLPGNAAARTDASCGLLRRASFEPGVHDVLSTPHRASFNDYAAITAAARRPPVATATAAVATVAATCLGRSGSRLWSGISAVLPFGKARKNRRERNVEDVETDGDTTTTTTTTRRRARSPRSKTASGRVAPSRLSPAPPSARSSTPSCSSSAEKGPKEPEVGEHPVFRDMPFVGDWERPVTLPPLSFEERPGSVISFDPERFRGSTYDAGDGCGGALQEVESTKRPWSVVSEESSNGISVESGSASGSTGSWNSEDAREKELRYKRDLRQLRRRRERIGRKKASLQKKVAFQALLLQRLEKEQDGGGEQQDAESAQYNECSTEEYEPECERARHLPRASSAPLPLLMSGAQDADEDSVPAASMLARPQTTLFFTGAQEQHSLAPRPFFVPRWWWRRGKWGANESKSPKNSGAAENKRNVDGSDVCSPSEPGDISKQSEQRGKLRKRQKGTSDGEDKLKCMEREALQAILDFSTAVLKAERDHQGKLEHTSGPKEHAWKDKKDEMSIPLRSLSLGRSFSKKKTYQHVEDRSEGGTGETRLSRELVRSLSLRQTIFRKSKERVPESERGYTDALNEARGSSSLRRRRKKIPAPLEQTRFSYEDDVLDTEEEQLTGESVLQREERPSTRPGPEYFPVVDHGHVKPAHRPTNKAQVAFPTIPRDQSERHQAHIGHPRPQMWVPLGHYEDYSPENGDRGTQWSYFLAPAEFPKPPSFPPHLCTCTLHRPTRPPPPSRIGRLPLPSPLTVGPEGYRAEELPLSSGASAGPPLHVIPEAEEWDTVVSQAHEGVHQDGKVSSVPNVGTKTCNHSRSRYASKTVNSPIKEGSRTTLQTGICSDYEGIKAASNKNYGNKRSPDMSLGVDSAADSEAGREYALEDGRRLCSCRNSSSTMEMYHTGSTSKTSTTDLMSATSVEFPITAVAQEAAWHIQKMGSTSQPACCNENRTRPNVERARSDRSLNEECRPPPDEMAYEQGSKAEAVKPPEDEAFAKFMNAQARLANRTSQPANSLPTFLRGYHEGGNGRGASAKQARQDSANESVTLPVGRHSSSGE